MSLEALEQQLAEVREALNAYGDQIAWCMRRKLMGEAVPYDKSKRDYAAWAREGFRAREAQILSDIEAERARQQTPGWGAY